MHGIKDLFMIYYILYMKMDPTKKTSLMDALTMFDRLVARMVARGGNLSEKDKKALDNSLVMHAQAAAVIKMSPGQAVPEFTPQ